jgi:signal transduction histidine kinase
VSSTTSNVTLIDQLSLNKVPAFVWVLVLSAAVTFFTVSAFFTYRSIDIITTNNTSINNTLQTINLIKDLHKEIIAAESSQRGYLITEDPEYLEPYHQTLTVVDGLLLKLSNSTTELPSQKVRFEALYTYIRRKIDEMEKTVILTDRDKIRAAVRQVKTDEGIELMRTISQLIAEMEVDEFALLNKNKLIAANNRNFIEVALLLANGIGLGLALGVFFIWHRNASRISDLNNELTRVNTELEEKVVSRTQALLQYSEELQRSNRELEEFAFVASHDLQEPLRKIRAFGDRLQQKFSSDLGDVGADYVARMQAASLRMSTLIDDLLSFSRVTTKQRPFVSVDLNEVMRGVMNDLDYAIEESTAQVHIDPLPIIDADASQLAQVFMNLIANSLKFHAAEARPIITVTCETRIASPVADDDRGWCCLRFADQGIGFEAQYAERVFSLFQRLHGRDEYTGTGIGLALCRKIVERHGGTISAQSEPGEGAVFIINLPMKQIAVESLTELLMDVAES